MCDANNDSERMSTTNIPVVHVGPAHPVVHEHVLGALQKPPL